MTDAVLHQTARQETLLQVLKWIIYGLLITNLGHYWFDDWRVAQHTLTEDSTFLQWMGAYATTFDDFAWIVLILIYETETHWLEDVSDNKLLNRTMQFAKVICYGLILQTTYSYVINLKAVYSVSLIPNTRDLCDIANLDLSFLRNLSFVDINVGTCATIAYAGDLYMYPTQAIVTDMAGLIENVTLRQVDLVENVCWLIVPIMLELEVRLQKQGYHEGPGIFWSYCVKIGAYGLILAAAAFWFAKGHYFFAWDEFIWVAGFVAVDLNLSEWREQLEDEENTVERNDAVV